MPKYASSHEVKAFSQVSASDLGYSSDADYASFVNSLIDYAEAVVEAYCGTSWTSENVPAAVKFVVLQLVSNVLHQALQRKIAPVVSPVGAAGEMRIRVVISEAFTADLKALLDAYRVLDVTLEERVEEP
jgi:hypothetical protein